MTLTGRILTDTFNARLTGIEARTMSYYVAYKHPGLGQRKSSNFALESDALAYRAGQPQEWPGGVVYTPEPPDIFRHCGPADDARNPSQAVGGKCFWCGKVLTRADAREHARPVK